MEKSIEIFTLITGVLYVILEIRQKNLMWVLGIFTSLASMWVFMHSALYASFCLQVYYFVTAFIGLWHWIRDGRKLGAESSIHLNPLTRKTVVVSAVAAVAGVAALTWGMELLATVGMKENPMSVLDASATVLSVVATWWLVKSYLQQWWLWIVADALSTVLCLTQGMWWMAALYLAYTAGAVIGLRYWKKNGVLIV